MDAVTGLRAVGVRDTCDREGKGTEVLPERPVRVTVARYGERLWLSREEPLGFLDMFSSSSSVSANSPS